MAFFRNPPVGSDKSASNCGVPCATYSRTSPRNYPSKTLDCRPRSCEKLLIPGLETRSVHNHINGWTPFSMEVLPMTRKNLTFPNLPKRYLKKSKSSNPSKSNPSTARRQAQLNTEMSLIHAGEGNPLDRSGKGDPRRTGWGGRASQVPIPIAEPRKGHEITANIWKEPCPIVTLQAGVPAVSLFLMSGERSLTFPLSVRLFFVFLDLFMQVSYPSTQGPANMKGYLRIFLNDLGKFPFVQDQEKRGADGSNGCRTGRLLK